MVLSAEIQRKPSGEQPIVINSLWYDLKNAVSDQALRFCLLCSTDLILSVQTIVPVRTSGPSRTAAAAGAGAPFMCSAVRTVYRRPVICQSERYRCHSEHQYHQKRDQSFSHSFFPPSIVFCFVFL